MARELALGKIVGVKPMDKGYKRLEVAVNAPFRTKRLKFNIWNDNLLLKETSEPYKAGDTVALDFHVQGSYLRLNNLKPMDLDSCPICYAYREATDAQRLDSPCCELIPEESRKTRIDCRMMLQSKCKKQYMYSEGMKLQLAPVEEEEDVKTYTTVIFENSPLYSKVPALKTGNIYCVIGWVSKKLLDIIDIY